MSQNSTHDKNSLCLHKTHSLEGLREIYKFKKCIWIGLCAWSPGNKKDAELGSTAEGPSSASSESDSRWVSQKLTLRRAYE